MGFLSWKLTGAAFRGDLNEVKRLLDEGVDVNAKVKMARLLSIGLLLMVILMSSSSYWIEEQI